MPVVDPVKLFDSLSFVNSADNPTELTLALVKEKVGFITSAMFIIPDPNDSIVFKIPSLSLSKSRLSIIPSSSKSVGQTLIGISLDL